MNPLIPFSTAQAGFQELQRRIPHTPVNYRHWIIYRPEARASDGRLCRGRKYLDSASEGRSHGDAVEVAANLRAFGETRAAAADVSQRAYRGYREARVRTSSLRSACEYFSSDTAWGSDRVTNSPNLAVVSCRHE